MTSVCPGRVEVRPLPIVAHGLELEPSPLSDPLGDT